MLNDSKAVRQLFQSTHSRGVRPGAPFELVQLVDISIHALTRSATSVRVALYYQKQISIHALTRSATISSGNFSVIGMISIHALTRSATSSM